MEEEEGGGGGKPKAKEISTLLPSSSSPSNSQQTISDDDEIDYSIKPEFYDPDLDCKDELWIDKKRQGRTTDAVLSCPGCFTTLCLECQRHEKYLTQYRAIFVMNCEVVLDKAYRQSKDATAAELEALKLVRCSVCSTEVGVMDEEEIYHFYSVLPTKGSTPKRAPDVKKIVSDAVAKKCSEIPTAHVDALCILIHDCFVEFRARRGDQPFVTAGRF
ncbi:hypothetical protein MLD38_019063 [Melastoma candidum]|uniref:Uncharacterized protein n=1 Tax=Melastoma candidum TaxID=119954 RepID=A0ACB9QVT1_9MYRT|nr:hypothetical protein MLD38_019063 [Melastoma candidum]